MEDILATLMMLLIVFVLLSGLGMFLVGFFKLGNLIQFLPFPLDFGLIAYQRDFLQSRDQTANDFLFYQLVQFKRLKSTIQRIQYGINLRIGSLILIYAK